MSSQKLSNEESIRIITDMIGNAKKSITKAGSFYFLLWGFTCAIANFSQYILAEVVNFQPSFITWLVVFPAIIATIIYSIKQRNKSVIKSYFDKIYGQIWIAISVAIVCVLLFMNQIEYNHNAIILLLAGCGTYITGQMIRFKPLIFGGLSLFIAAFICFSISPSEQNIVAGIGIIIGYLIPGFLLKRQESE